MFVDYLNINSTLITKNSTQYISNVFTLDLTSKSVILANTMSTNITGTVYKESGIEDVYNGSNMNNSSHLAIGTQTPRLLPQENTNDTTAFNWNNLTNQIWYKEGVSATIIKVAEITLATNASGTVQYLYADERQNIYAIYNLDVSNGYIVKTLQIIKRITINN